MECFTCFQVMSGKESSDRYSRFRSERFQQGHVPRRLRTVQFQDQEHAPARRRSWAVGRDRSSSHSVPARRRSSTVGRERPSAHRDRRWAGPARVSRDYQSSARGVRTQSPSLSHRGRSAVRARSCGDRSHTATVSRRARSNSRTGRRSEPGNLQVTCRNMSRKRRGTDRPESPPSKRTVTISTTGATSVTTVVLQPTPSTSQLSVAQDPRVGATSGAEPTPSTSHQSTAEPTPSTSQQTTSQAQESKVVQKSIALSRRKSCPLCQKTVDHLRRHVEKYHLPWYFCPELACWQCQESCVTLGQLWRVHGVCSGGAFTNNWLKVWVATMRGWIHLAAQLAECEGLNSLLDKFLDEKWFDRQGGVMTSFTRSTLLWWVQEAGGQSVREVHLNPPNCPAAVLSWYRCLQLLQSLCAGDREKLVTYPLRERPEEMTPLTTVKAADGHFHLESLPMDAAALQGLFWMDSAVGEPAIRIDLGIWNCVFARSWEFPLPATGVTIWRTYGVHPRLAGQQLPWCTLLRLFGAEECCGIGECGLDKTAPNMEAQEELFKTQVRAALRTRKPLVLHLRSTSSSTALMHQRVRTLMAAVLNKSHRVYLHCFVGMWDTNMKWNQAFPQLLLGFSRLTVEMTEFQKLARSLPLHQLALESDSPHLGHSPRQLIDQAIAVAECRNLPVAAVLEGTRRNVEKFFS